MYGHQMDELKELRRFKQEVGEALGMLVPEIGATANYELVDRIGALARYRTYISNTIGVTEADLAALSGEEIVTHLRNADECGQAQWERDEAYEERDAALAAKDTITEAIEQGLGMSPGLAAVTHHWELTDRVKAMAECLTQLADWMDAGAQLDHPEGRTDWLDAFCAEWVPRVRKALGRKTRPGTCMREG